MKKIIVDYGIGETYYNKGEISIGLSREPIREYAPQHDDYFINGCLFYLNIYDKNNELIKSYEMLEETFDNLNKLIKEGKFWNAEEETITIKVKGYYL